MGKIAICTLGAPVKFLPGSTEEEKKNRLLEFQHHMSHSKDLKQQGKIKRRMSKKRAAVLYKKRRQKEQQNKLPAPEHANKQSYQWANLQYTKAKRDQDTLKHAYERRRKKRLEQIKQKTRVIGGKKRGISLELQYQTRGRESWERQRVRSGGWRC